MIDFLLLAVLMPMVPADTAPSEPPTRMTILVDAFGKRPELRKDRGCSALIERAWKRTNAVTSIRFAFFFVQIVAFLWLVGIIVITLRTAT